MFCFRTKEKLETISSFSLVIYYRSSNCQYWPCFRLGAVGIVISRSSGYLRERGLLQLTSKTLMSPSTYVKMLSITGWFFRLRYPEILGIASRNSSERFSRNSGSLETPAPFAHKITIVPSVINSIVIKYLFGKRVSDRFHDMYLPYFYLLLCCLFLCCVYIIPYIFQIVNLVKTRLSLKNPGLARDIFVLLLFSAFFRFFKFIFLPIYMYIRFSLSNGLAR